MNPNIQQAKEIALEQIELAKERIYALEFALSWKDYQHRSDCFQEEYYALRAELFRRLNDAYGRYFMWVIGVNDDEEYKKARRKAFKRFLDENMEIMGYLRLDDKTPGSYFTNVEKAFRKNINKHFVDVIADPHYEKEEQIEKDANNQKTFHKNKDDVI